MRDVYGNSYCKRLLLFIFGCIGVRSLLAYIAKIINVKYLPYLGYLALLPMIGWLYIYFTGSRTTGPEVFGDKIWWNNLRPLHAILYGLFAWNAINKNTNSYIYLVIDVVFALFVFILHRYKLI